MTRFSSPLDDRGRLLERPRTGPTPIRAVVDPVPAPGLDGVDDARAELLGSLRTLARAARAEAGLAGGAGLTVLLGGGRVHAGSDASAEALEAMQDALAEGPGCTAVAARCTVRSGTVGTVERRWPQLVRRARSLGVRAMISLPLLAGGEPLGVLTLYFRTAADLGATPEDTLRRAAHDALQTLLDLRLRALLEESSRSLECARRERSEVDLAVGLLMDRYGFTASQATVLVVQLARQDGVSTEAAARGLTGRDGQVVRPRPWGGPDRPARRDGQPDLDRVLAADLRGLVADLRTGEGTRTSLLMLEKHLDLSVPSALGLTLVLGGRARGPVVRLNLLRRAVQPDEVAAVLEIALSALVPRAEGTVVLYASHPRAFVHLGTALGLAPGDLAEQRTRPTRALVPGIEGLQRRATFDRALGVLLNRGYDLTGALTELQGRAEAARTDLGTAARTLLAAPSSTA